MGITKPWALVFRFFIGYINYLIVLKSPVELNTIRTDLIISMAFLYDFATIQKDHRIRSGKAYNLILIVLACGMSLMFLAGFVEPIFGSSQYPLLIQNNGQAFITSLSFKVPYNWVVNGVLYLAMGSLLESVLLVAHEKGYFLRKKTATENTHPGTQPVIPLATGIEEQAATTEGVN